MHVVLDDYSVREWGSGLHECGFKPSASTLTDSQQRAWSVVGGSDAESVLIGEGVWDTMHVVGEVGYSQFDAIVEMMRENRGGLGKSFAAFAIEGAGFHGNRQRKWHACAGNIHLSCFRPLDLDASLAACLSMIPTLAVCDAVEPFLDTLSPRPGIKWINDVYLDGRKLSGALTHTEVVDGRITGVAYGIGLNVEVAPNGIADASVGAATSLKSHSATKAHASDVGLNLLACLGVRLSQLSKGAEALILDAYRRLSICIGRHVAIAGDAQFGEPSDRIVGEGKLLGIYPDLSLEIEGCVEPVRSGRIVLMR